MSNAVLKGNASGTGTVTLETPNTNSDITISMPAAAGTMMVSGNMPAFSAYLGGAQTVSAGTFAKVQCNVEEFDTNSNYDTSNYRFTPTVAGYYQVTCAVQEGAGASLTLQTNIYKNGTAIKKSSYSGAIAYYACTLSALVYMNGTTDYLEFYAFASASAGLNSVASATYFEAVMVRAA
jgi:hypothetical protein